MKQVVILMGMALLASTLTSCRMNNPAEEPAALAGRASTILEMPATGHAQEKLSTFIGMIRTGNRDTVAQLIRNHMAEFLQSIPIEEHTDNLMEFHQGFSQVEFNRYVLDEPHAATGLFYNTYTDSWVRIGVQVDKEPPHRINLISIEPAEAP